MSVESTPKKKSGIIRKLILGSIAGVVGLIILAMIFAPSDEEVAASKRAFDSAEAVRIQRSADSVAKVKADFAALPKATRDSIAKARRDDSTAKAKEKAETSKREKPRLYLTVKNWEWSKGGFETVGLIKVTFKNAGVMDAKDIQIKVTWTGESGTALGSETKLVPIVVKAGTSKTTEELNMGFLPDQTKSAMIDIIDATFQ